MLSIRFHVTLNHCLCRKTDWKKTGVEDIADNVSVSSEALQYNYKALLIVSFLLRRLTTRYKNYLKIISDFGKKKKLKFRIVSFNFSTE